RLIQIAEFLDDPPKILNETYSTGVWQNRTMDAAKACGRGEGGAIERLGLELGLSGYPVSQTANGESIAQAGLQYIETHDHERFICTFGTRFRDDNRRDD